MGDEAQVGTQGYTELCEATWLPLLIGFSVQHSHFMWSSSWESQAILACCPIAEAHNAAAVVPLLARPRFLPTPHPSLSCLSSLIRLKNNYEVPKCPKERSPSLFAPPQIVFSFILWSWDCSS